jgi:ubiquinone/menaquinone biosynthesis C-methylase UbiE
LASLVEIFQTIFEPLTYRAPGSEASTLRALLALSELGTSPQIIDIGCGVGRQTLHLAQHTDGHVTAVDLSAGSLKTLTRVTREQELSDRIEAVRGSMTQLGFADQRFDLIWSEGAIYSMGFAAGLAAWKRLLRPGGCMALTELTWLTKSRPEATSSYWKNHYPAMLDLRDNLAAIDDAGYQQIGNFALPESDWWDVFYRDLSAEVREYKRQHRASANEEYEGQAVIELLEDEMETLRKSQGSYSYVFYIMRKPA